MFDCTFSGDVIDQPEFLIVQSWQSGGFYGFMAPFIYDLEIVSVLH